MGIPFKEDSGDPLTLDTKDIMDQIVIDSVKQAHTLSKELALL